MPQDIYTTYLEWPDGAKTAVDLKQPEKPSPPFPDLIDSSYDEAEQILRCLERQLFPKRQQFLRDGYGWVFYPKLQPKDIKPTSEFVFAVYSPPCCRAVEQAMRDLLIDGVRDELEKFWKPSWEYFEDAGAFELTLDDIANAFDTAAKHGYGFQLSMA